jgi:hypothetical protein
MVEGYDTRREPTADQIATAVQVWSALNFDPVTEAFPTVSATAKAFNLDAETVRAAVEKHPWMVLLDAERIDQR